MKKIVFVAILTTLLIVVSLFPAMTINGDVGTTTKEQCRCQLESAFINYLHQNKIPVTSQQPSNLTFRNFINSNSEFRNLLEKYTNFTKAELSANLKENSPDISAAQLTPIKTVTATVAEKTYNVSISQGRTGTEDFTKIDFCGGGVDPWIYISVQPLTAGFFNGLWVYNYGEVDTVIYHVYSNETTNFLTQFYNTLYGTAALNAVYWALAGIGVTAAAALAGVPYSAAIGTAVSVAGTSASTYDIQCLIADTNLAVDNSQLDHGLKIKIESTYITPWAMPIVLPDLAVYAWHFGDNSWYKTFPMTPYWTFTNVVVEEMLAYEIKQVVHGIGDHTPIGYDHWTWLNDPPPAGSPPTTANGICNVGVNSYDTYSSQYINGANVNLDGYSVGTTGSAFPITPEQHEFHLPQFALYDRLFYEYQGYEQLGAEQTLTVQISTDTTITGDYSVPYQVTVDVCGTDQYSQFWYNNFGYTPVYSDGHFIGNAPGTFTLAGPHAISVDPQISGFYLPTTFQYYDPSNYVTGPSSSTINVWYWIWTF
jgi:hypothetical protein